MNVRTKVDLLRVLALVGKNIIAYHFLFWQSLDEFFRFGVCCVFIYNSATNTISVNDSYIQNPGFPSAYTGTSQVSYTIQKCSNGKSTITLLFGPK